MANKKGRPAAALTQIMLTQWSTTNYSITKGWLALINGIFKKYDEEATLENVLAEFKEYRVARLTLTTKRTR